MSTDRYHGLDALRAVAMLLGVVLHGVMSYLTVDIPWWPMDERGALAVWDLVIYWIHSFRMPLFFLLAGFFGHLLSDRLGTRAFLRHRFRRVFLPFAAAMVLIMPAVFVAMVVALVTMKGKAALETLESEGSERSGLDAIEMMHLWFLHYLVWMYVIAAFCGRLFGRVAAPLDSAFGFVLRSRAAVPCLAVPVALLHVLLIHLGEEPSGLIPKWWIMGYYTYFFAVGWFLHRRRELLETIERRWLMHLIAAAVLFVPTLAVGVDAPDHAASHILHGVHTMAWILGLTGLFLRFFRAPSGRWRFVADSSYWVYLIHMPIIPLVVLLLWASPVPGLLRAPLAIFITGAIGLISYRCFVRDTFIGVFLNGRRFPTSTPALPVDTSASVASNPEEPRGDEE